MSIPSAQPFTLSEEDIRFFDLFGYLHLPGLFTDEVAELSAAFNRVIEAHQHEAKDHVHEAHYENRRKILYRFIEKDPVLLELLADKRIQGIAKGLAGDDYNYTGGEGNIFTGDTIWHRDSYGVIKKHRYIKIAFYLEDIDENSGCLRFMPGSHHQQQPFSKRLHSILDNHQESIGLSAEEMPAQIVPSKAGDVVVFDFSVQHATCNSKFPRRMFNIAMTQHFNQNRQEQCIQSFVDSLTQNDAVTNTLFGPELINHPDPEVRRHITQPIAMEQEAYRRINALKNKP